MAKELIIEGVDLFDVPTNRRDKRSMPTNVRLEPILDRLREYLTRDGSGIRAETIHGAGVFIYVDQQGYLTVSVDERAAERRIWRIS